MSQVARLKKQAADFELKRQFDKAIAVYVKLLDSFDQHSAELDVALFNRVGDLMLRQGNVADAVDYYERAVDQYADTGFFNNAIALCNKILRYSPGRASVYYKLGRISAKKGFTNEARTNFLEYADRMQKAGNVDEAFRALTEFADLCPDQEEIRLMLAEQLTRAGRGDEAIEQYQVLYERCDRQGRKEDARHVLERMRAIDSSVEPRAVEHEDEDTDSGLIFLDLDDDGSPSAPAPAPRATAGHRPAAPPRQFAPPPRIMPAPEPEAQPEPETLDDALQEALEGITRIGDDVEPLEIISSDSLLGLEPTGLADESTMISGFDAVGTDGVDVTDAYAETDSQEQGTAQPSFDDDIPLDGLPLVTVESESALSADLDEDLLDDEPIVVPTPSVARRATVEAAHSVELLRARIDGSPNDWRLRRDLAEAMLEAGERNEGIRELESAMSGAERSGDLELAASIAEEIARLEPDVVKHHQKRVEYAFRTNDRARLIEAYVALADVLFRSDQADKARTIYQRVLDLAPDEPRARAGLDALTRGSGEVDAYPSTTPTVDQAPIFHEPREKPVAPKSSWGGEPAVGLRRRTGSSTWGNGCARRSRRATHAWSFPRMSPRVTKRRTSPTCCGSSSKGSPRTWQSRTTRATTTWPSRSRRWVSSMKRSPSSRRRSAARPIACRRSRRSASASSKRISSSSRHRSSAAGCTRTPARTSWSVSYIGSVAPPNCRTIRPRRLPTTNGSSCSISNSETSPIE